MHSRGSWALRAFLGFVLSLLAFWVAAGYGREVPPAARHRSAKALRERPAERRLALFSQNAPAFPAREDGDDDDDDDSDDSETNTDGPSSQRVDQAALSCGSGHAPGMPGRAAVLPTHSPNKPLYLTKLCLLI